MVNVFSGTFSIWQDGGITGSGWLVDGQQSVVVECTEDDSLSPVSDV